jgi:aminopeptidase N
MKFILPFFLFATFGAIAQQQPADNCKQVTEIAYAEMQRHKRLDITGASGFAGIATAASNFDAKYYRCEWELDPNVRFIKGKVTVYYTLINAGTSISLDLMNDLVVDSVTQRNILVTKQHTNNVLQINFAATVNTGVLDSASIYYQGVPANTGFGSFIKYDHLGTPVIWSLSEPYGSRDWWPCKNGLDDKADSIDVILTAPAQYKAASNGMLQSETLVNGGTQITAHWKHRYPIASYLVCFAVTNYVVFNNSVQLGSVTVPMQTYCYPESLTSFKNGTQNTLDAMVLFHNNFGDYPFIKEKYGHVQFGWGGGMEHQTSSFMVSVNEGLVAHELAHQWFGDKITCGSWEDIWLNEGFATHLASFYTENKYPANTLINRKNVINSITSQPGGSVWVNDTTNPYRIFDGRLSYNKGSYLIYMLRWKLGDAVFFNAIKNYNKDPAVVYGFAKTADLKRNLEQESGQNLTEFFKDWYKGEGYPTYNVEWTPMGSSYVKIKMNQTTSHPSVNFFEMPVALKFKSATQEKTIVLDNKTNGELFFKNLGFVADTVLIDPEYWLISKNNTTVKIADVVTGQNVVQIFPNPIKEQFAVYLRNFTAVNTTLTLFDATGRLVYIKKLPLANGTEYLEIPSQYLPKSIYYLQIKSDDGFKYVKKLLK